MRSKVIFYATIATFLAGCGGGSSGTGGGGAGKEDFNVGPFSGTGAVTGKTVTTNSANYSALGFSGTFTSLRLKSNSVSLGSIRLLGSMGDSPNGEVRARLAYFGAGGTVLDYVGASTAAGFPAMTPDARTIFFTQITRNFPPYVARLKKMSFDGTGLANLTTPPTGYYDAWSSVSPNGAQVVFTRVTDDGSVRRLRKVTVATGAVSASLITTGFDDANFPTFSNDGKYVYFISKGDDADWEAYKVLATGGTPEVVYDLSDGDVREFIDAPNGDGQIAVVSTSTGTQVRHVGGSSRVLLDGPEYYASLSPISKSPYFAYIADNNGMEYRIYDLTTDQETTVWRSGQGTAYITAVPPQAESFLAGSGGLFGPSLHGLLATRQGAEVASLVGFRATTPSTIVLTSLTGENTTGPNLDFEVVADRLTFAGYLDKDKVLPKTAVGSAPVSANGMFVSFDARTGKVATIIPYTGSRSAKAYARHGRESVFEGTFLGVYNGQGENLAMNGASRVRVQEGQVTVER